MPPRTKQLQKPSPATKKQFAAASRKIEEQSDSDFVPSQEDEDEEEVSLVVEDEGEVVPEEGQEEEEELQEEEASTSKGRRKRQSQTDRNGKHKKVKQEDGDCSPWGPFGDQDDEEINPEDLVRNKVYKQAEPPKGLLMDLLPFQREFLAWGLEQEIGPIKGGLLCDEMGMGKTIQMISLIMQHRNDDEDQNAIAQIKVNDTKNCKSATESVCESTGRQKALRLKLPGAPVSTRETAHVVPSTSGSSIVDSEKLFIAVNGMDDDDNGKQKETQKKEEDIEEGRKGAKGKKKVAKKPKKTNDPGPVNCFAETANLTDAEYCGATLVICPLVAVVQWCQEIAKHTVPGALKVIVYQGPKRSLDPDTIAHADVVVTTYNTIEADYRKAMMPAKIACHYCGKRYLVRSIML